MKRWYEQDPTLKQSIELIEVFPDDALTVIAEGINKVAEREFKAKELMRSYKELGQEKVLALYKSKRKQRKYDKNPNMNTLINYFLLINESHRSVLAEQVIELAIVVQEYLDTCTEKKVPADVEHMKSIRDHYLTSGEPAAREELKKAQEEVENAGRLIRNFNESDGGMKINFKRVKE